MNGTVRETWKYFEGLGNTEAVLQRKAEMLALSLVLVTKNTHLQFLEACKDHSCQKELCSFLESSESHEYDLFAEFLYFFIHVTDRYAAQHLTDQQHRMYSELLLSDILAEIVPVFSLSDKNRYHFTRKR